MLPQDQNSKWPRDDVHPRVMSDREYRTWAEAKIQVLEADVVKLRSAILDYFASALSIEAQFRLEEVYEETK